MRDGMQELFAVASRGSPTRRPPRTRVAALGAALVALPLLIAVQAIHAQSAAVGPDETIVIDGITVFNASGQPANVALANGQLDVALPIGVAADVQGAECMAVVPAPNFARCRVQPGARVTLGSAGGSVAPPPAETASPSPQVTPQVQPPFPQPPMALSRAGTGGLDVEEPALRWAMVALAMYACCFVALALAIRRRARR